VDEDENAFEVVDASRPYLSQLSSSLFFHVEESRTLRNHLIYLTDLVKKNLESQNLFLNYAIVNIMVIEDLNSY